MIDMSGVDLNLLISLDTLLEELNVTKAASHLEISQPALSAQLQRLRKMFGNPLLLPSETGRGMIPTARALAMQAELRELLKGLQTLVRREPAFDPATAQRTFAVATSDNAVLSLGLPLIARVAAQAGPGVQLTLRNVVSSRIAAELSDGTVDLLIGSERAVPDTMRGRPLLPDGFVMAQRKRHPRGPGPLDMDTYCALDHALVSTSGGSLHGYLDEQLAKLGRHRKVLLSVQHFTLMPAILLATDYVCTLPRQLAARFSDQLDLFELPFEVQGFTLSAAWHPRNHVDPASLWLRGQLIEVAEEAIETGKRAAIGIPAKRLA